MTDTSISSRLVKTVGSSVINEIEYSYATQILTVRFASSDAVWQYSNVPPETFGQLMASKSVGNAYNKLVKNNFVGTKLHIKSKDS